MNKEQDPFSISKIYDISIYEGKIFSVVNEVENFEAINESIYHSIQSDIQIEQRSFEEVACFPSKVRLGVDGYKLSINSPKLENIRIQDVVKEGSQTFGTIYCKVSGYLLDSILEEEEIEIETCDGCNRAIEECDCPKPVLTDIDLPPIRPPFPGPFNRNSDSSFGCLEFFGILAALIILISIGLPGFFFLLLIGLLYFIGRSNLLSKVFSWLAYIALAIFFIAVIFAVINDCNGSTGNKAFIEPEPRPSPTIGHPRQETVQPLDNGTLEKTDAKKSDPIPVDPTPALADQSVYVCNGNYSERYHLTPYCRGLSNCRATISSISKDEARNIGRTLCGWED
ncbi:hypothetical protein [Flagellimonas oceanensis]|uniref:hypothetical protein n=1 Tax=Flagellimonas oceanensis TaxID=2499163 RepID=UPI001F161FF1|nr:hypothetical protein [Allomuricauda oceanensis]